MREATLKDAIFDQIAEAQGIEVPTECVGHESAVFDVRFRVTVDRATYAAMQEVGLKQGRGTRSLLRRYCRLAFRTCLAAVPDAEAA
jgi:hypothetical protein